MELFVFSFFWRLGLNLSWIHAYKANGQNGFAYGVQAIGIGNSPGVTAATAETHNTQITVEGHAASIGLFAVDAAEINNSTLRLIVTANNNQAIGALAQSSSPDSAFISIVGTSNITVTGDPSSFNIRECRISTERRLCVLHDDLYSKWSVRLSFFP